MIALNHRDGKPIYQQIEDGFRHHIVSGLLSPDEKLPSVRELASQLAINPNTIQRAYRDLEAEGYIYSMVGKGSFVAPQANLAGGYRKEKLANIQGLLAELRASGMTKSALEVALTALLKEEFEK